MYILRENKYLEKLLWIFDDFPFYNEIKGRYVENKNKNLEKNLKLILSHRKLFIYFKKNRLKY